LLKKPLYRIVCHSRETGCVAKKLSRYPDRRSALLQAFELSQRIAIRSIRVDHLQVIYLAEKTGLTTYDASYLWLAHKIGGTLVTLDGTLKIAAAKIHVKAA
jgi:predicted nucleic acid-binding protein